MSDNPGKMSEEPRPGIGCWIAFAILCGLTGLIVWVNARARRVAENENEAVSSLKGVLASAEADFRANDRDGNGVNDFWTGDVAGLFKYGLIPRALAEADVEPLQPLVPKPIPYKGYYYRVLDADDSDPRAGPYRQDTDRKSGKVHNLHKFGFVAIPAEPGVTGRIHRILNENGTVFRGDASRPAPRNWPSDEDLRQQWGKH